MFSVLKTLKTTDVAVLDIGTCKL